jgi:hypothetical protein
VIAWLAGAWLAVAGCGGAVECREPGQVLAEQGGQTLTCGDARAVRGWIELLAGRELSSARPEPRQRGVGGGVPRRPSCHADADRDRPGGRPGARRAHRARGRRGAVGAGVRGRRRHGPRPRRTRRVVEPPAPRAVRVDEERAGGAGVDGVRPRGVDPVRVVVPRGAGRWGAEGLGRRPGAGVPDVDRPVRHGRSGHDGGPGVVRAGVGGREGPLAGGLVRAAAGVDRGGAAASADERDLDGLRDALFQSELPPHARALHDVLGPFAVGDPAVFGEGGSP